MNRLRDIRVTRQTGLSLTLIASRAVRFVTLDSICRVLEYRSGDNLEFVPGDPAGEADEILRYLVAIVMTLGAAGCGSDDGPGAFSVPLLARANNVTGGGDRVAVELARNGYCADAIPILQCYVYRGRGNEMAQATLGSCLIENANVGDGDWHNGVTWLRRAGDTGLLEAQNRLVRALSQSSSDSDIVEAQTWRIIYERGKSSPFPPPPLPQEAISKLEARLTPAQHREAQEKARLWSYRFWVMQATDADDAKEAMEECKRARQSVEESRRRRESRFQPPDPAERRNR